MNITKLLPAILALAVAPFALAKGDHKKGDAKKCADQEQQCEMQGIDDATKTKLKAAMETAAKDPEVVKAKQAFDAARDKAKTAEGDAKTAAQAEVKTAAQAFHAANKAAMLKADPSLAAAIAKCEASCKEGNKDEASCCTKDAKKGKKGKKKHAEEAAPAAE